MYPCLLLQVYWIPLISNPKNLVWDITIKPLIVRQCETQALVTGPAAVLQIRMRRTTFGCVVVFGSAEVCLVIQ